MAFVQAAMEHVQREDVNKTSPVERSVQLCELLPSRMVLEFFPAIHPLA